jgi:hypothetical protein
MAKMTKAQARKRLKEASNKFKAVYMESWSGKSSFDDVISVADMNAIEKIIKRCMKRLK